MCIVCVCIVSVSVYFRTRMRVQASPNFLCILLTATARSSSGGDAMFELPVLWMTSYLHIMTGTDDEKRVAQI